MAKLNVFDPAARRPRPPSIGRTLTAPGFPDMSITFKWMDDLDDGVAVDLARELIADYVDGHGDTDPLKLAVPGYPGAAPLSNFVLVKIANLMTAQVPDGDDEPYSLVEWVGMMLYFSPLFHAAYQLWEEAQSQAPAKKPDDEAGNSPAQATAPG